MSHKQEIPEILASVGPLHEQGLRVILGVRLGVTEHHRVEVLGPEHGEAPDHDSDDEDYEAIAEALLRGPGLGLQAERTEFRGQINTSNRISPFWFSACNGRC